MNTKKMWKSWRAKLEVCTNDEFSMVCCCIFSSAEENPMCTPTARDSYERLSLAGQALPPGFPSPFLFPDGLSSIETLLTNIQVRSSDRLVSSWPHTSVRLGQKWMLELLCPVVCVKYDFNNGLKCLFQGVLNIQENLFFWDLCILNN